MLSSAWSISSFDLFNYELFLWGFVIRLFSIPYSADGSCWANVISDAVSDFSLKCQCCGLLSDIVGSKPRLMLKHNSEHFFFLDHFCVTAVLQITEQGTWSAFPPVLAVGYSHVSFPLCCSTGVVSRSFLATCQDGGPVPEGLCPAVQCGEDHAVWTLHCSVWCLPDNKRACAWGSDWTR